VATVGDEYNENIDPTYVQNILDIFNFSPIKPSHDKADKTAIKLQLDDWLEKVTSAIEKVWEPLTFDQVPTFLQMIDLALVD